MGETTDAASQIGVPVKSRVLTGIPSDEIVRRVQELPADIIIIWAPTAEQACPHLLLGSVAEKVVRRAPCPILTVREDEHDFITP